MFLVGLGMVLSVLLQPNLHLVQSQWIASPMLQPACSFCCFILNISCLPVMFSVVLQHNLHLLSNLNTASIPVSLPPPSQPHTDVQFQQFIWLRLQSRVRTQEAQRLLEWRCQSLYKAGWLWQEKGCAPASHWSGLSIFTHTLVGVVYSPYVSAWGLIAHAYV